MRLVERRWTDLALGYQAVHSLQERLENEFGRALEVGQKHKYRRELTGWQKKRRVFFALVGLAPLSIIALCLTAYYYREAACILAWWLLTVVVILLTLAVAGWSYIREMVGGKPEPAQARFSANLEERWWQSLRPQEQPARRPTRRGEVDFTTLLGHSLPDDWLAVPALFNGGTSLLLLGPGGLWLFEIRDWSGVILKQDGAWKRLVKKKLELLSDPAPDDGRMLQHQAVLSIINEHLPHLAWIAAEVHGGVVFSHSRVKLYKERIIGNTAPYGPANAWLVRMNQAAVEDRLTMEVRLELLDALLALSSRPETPAVVFSSSKDEAERLHTEIAASLRETLTGMMK